MSGRGPPGDHGGDFVQEPESVERGYLDLDEGQLHYRRTRSTGAQSWKEQVDDTPVVLLHQAPSSSWSYARVLDSLSGTRAAIALDLPGFGGSFVPDSVEDVPSLASVVASALDAMEIADAHLVGHHTGASVALALATDHDHVRSLTVVGPPSLPQVDRRARLDSLDGDGVVPSLDPAGDYLGEHWRYFEAETDDLDLRHRLVVDALRGRAVWDDYYRAVFAYDFDRAFLAIDVPRLLMAAPGDVLWDGFERLRRAHADVEAVELDGGNLEPILDADALVDALSAFLDTVDADT